MLFRSSVPAITNYFPETISGAVDGNDYKGVIISQSGGVLYQFAYYYQTNAQTPCLAGFASTNFGDIVRLFPTNTQDLALDFNLADNTVTLTVKNAARIPVTGLVNGGVVSYTGTAPAISSETYAGQRITYVTLAAGASVTVKKL